MARPFRRLCILHFQCPLCSLDHDDNLYVSVAVDNLDDYVARLRDLSRDRESIQETIRHASIQFHQELGDLDQLMERAQRYGLRETRPPTLELTDESDYTCDHCGRTFETNPALREHMASCKRR